MHASGKIVLTEERTTLDSKTLKDGFDNGRLHTSAVHNGNSGSRKEPSLEMGDIRQRIHHLESSLNSALDSVRSRVKKVLSHEVSVLHVCSDFLILLLFMEFLKIKFNTILCLQINQIFLYLNLRHNTLEIIATDNRGNLFGGTCRI